MTRERYLVCNEYGVYYYRYTLPKWYLIKHLNNKKTVHISLLTKDFDVAKLRVRQLSIYMQSFLSKIKTEERSSNMADKNINAVIRDYRNYILSADPNEQNTVYWGTDKFDGILEHLRIKLGFIEHHGLLKFVNNDLDNVDELYERAEAKVERVNGSPFFKG